MMKRTLYLNSRSFLAEGSQGEDPSSDCSEQLIPLTMKASQYVPTSLRSCFKMKVLTRTMLSCCGNARTLGVDRGVTHCQ